MNSRRDGQRRLRRKRSRRSLSLFSGMSLDPICRLWLLRFMHLCQGNCDFIEDYGFEDDRLARKLGFSDCREKDEFRPRQAFVELRKLLAKAETSADKLQPSKVLLENLNRLSDRIPLTNCEQSLLAFAVLAHTDINLRTIFDGSHKVNGSTLAHVVAFVIGLNPLEVSSALEKEGTLYKSGLLKADNYESDGTVRDFLTPMSDKFANRLVFDTVDMSTLFESAFRAAPCSSLKLEDFEHLTRDVVPLLQHAHTILANRRRGINYLLHGAPGTGKTELSRVVGQELAVQNFEVVVSDEDGDPISTKDRACAYRCAQSYLGTSKSLVVFDEADDLINGGGGMQHLFGLFPSLRSSTSKAWLNRALESNDVPTIWIANDIDGVDDAVLRRFDRIVEVPVPPQKQRKRIVKRMIPNAEQDLVDALASSTDLVPAVIQNGVDFATLAIDDTKSTAWRDALLDTVNATLRSQSHGTVKLNGTTRLPPTYDIAFINANADLSTVAKQMCRTRNARICLNGPSGTGKTAYVRWLAQDLGVSLMRLNASDLIGPFVGQTEAQIRAAFGRAERSGDLLLIDEIDSFLMSRGGAKNHWEVTQVNEFLAQLESFDGIFVGTTNFHQSLDVASFRRFDLKVEFSYSNQHQVQEMLAAYCRHLKMSPPTPRELARIGQLGQLTPGDFAAVERRSQFTPMDNATEFIDGLVSECKAKFGDDQTMGFG